MNNEKTLNDIIDGLDKDKKIACLDVYNQSRKKYDDEHGGLLVSSDFLDYLRHRNDYCINMVELYLGDLK